MDGVSGESQIYWVPKGQGFAPLSGPKLSGKRTEHHIRPSEFFFSVSSRCFICFLEAPERQRFKQYGTPKAAQEPKDQKAALQNVKLSNFPNVSSILSALLLRISIGRKRRKVCLGRIQRNTWCHRYVYLGSAPYCLNSFGRYFPYRSSSWFAVPHSW